MSPGGAVERARLRDFYDDYVAYLDEGDFDSWLDLFVEESEYRVVSRENFERGLPLATMRCDSRTTSSACRARARRSSRPTP